jgi:hypothetical protein
MFLRRKQFFEKNYYLVGSEIDCFEPFFGFLMQFGFKYIGLTPGIPKGYFHHPQDVVYDFSFDYLPYTKL